MSEQNQAFIAYQQDDHPAREWVAMREGWEPGGLVGYGDTREDAIAHLMLLEVAND